jgi:hypothetical protein
MKIKQPKLIVRNYNAITEEITLCIIVELKKVSSNTVFMYNKTAYGVWHHFQQYFSYIVSVSFIGGGNLSTGTQKNTNLPQVADKLSHNVVSSTPCCEQVSNSLQWW